MEAQGQIGRSGLGQGWQLYLGSGVSTELLGLRTLQDAHRTLEGQQSVAPRQWGFAGQQWEQRGWPWRPLPRGSVSETFWQRIRRNQEVDMRGEELPVAC